MYTEKVMDHFKNPRNVGEIEGASGVGTVGNAKCGDIMQIFQDDAVLQKNIDNFYKKSRLVKYFTENPLKDNKK